jgi:hypothetical protein
MIGPSAGPNKGAEEKKIIARPRCLSGQISARMPPAMVNGDEPNAPARNLMITSPSTVGAKAHPAVKRVNTKY